MHTYMKLHNRNEQLRELTFPSVLLQCLFQQTVTHIKWLETSFRRYTAIQTNLQ